MENGPAISNNSKAFVEQVAESEGTTWADDVNNLVLPLVENVVEDIQNLSIDGHARLSDFADFIGSVLVLISNDSSQPFTTEPCQVQFH